MKKMLMAVMLFTVVSLFTDESPKPSYLSELFKAPIDVAEAEADREINALGISPVILG